MIAKRMCLGTFSRRARSLATTYIFARVRIIGSLVPFCVIGNSKEFPITQKDCRPKFLSLWTAAFSFLQNQLLSSIPYVLFSCFSTFLTYPSTVSALNASSFGVKRTVNAIDFLSAAICLPSYTSNRVTSLT